MSWRQEPFDLYVLFYIDPGYLPPVLCTQKAVTQYLHMHQGTSTRNIALVICVGRK